MARQTRPDPPRSDLRAALAALLDDVRFIETTLIREATERYEDSAAALSRIQTHLIHEYAALAASAPDEGPLPAGHPDTWPGGTMHMPASATDEGRDRYGRNKVAVRRAAAEYARPAAPVALDVIASKVTALAHLTPEDWAERRGADPIARTINAVLDIIREAR